MGNDIFSDVKERLNLKDVAEYYGLDVNRDGFTSCLFHDERTPSMKLYDDHYHCYGCGCHGDVTDLTARLFNLSPIDAARKLACDFRITTDERITDKKPTIKEKMAYYSYAAQESNAYRLLADYCDFLQKCKEEYAPARIGEDLNPIFAHAITEIDKFKYYRDIFITGTKDERISFLKDFSGVLGEIEKGFCKVKKARQATELV